MKHAMVLLALAVSVGLSSCDQDAFNDPAEEQSAPDAQTQITSVNANDRVPLIPKLVKYGNGDA
ncbi:hypothetical protein ACFSUS_16450 [Spirosoma soli]|uniref:Secreted protein n=1 Tax=Spirosoma soli TaxID=1770529 RepID=A0ABW5M786_9BACT